jgi:hypothetical protein
VTIPITLKLNNLLRMLLFHTKLSQQLVNLRQRRSRTVIPHEVTSVLLYVLYFFVSAIKCIRKITIGNLTIDKSIFSEGKSNYRGIIKMSTSEINRPRSFALPPVPSKISAPDDLWFYNSAPCSLHGMYVIATKWERIFMRVVLLNCFSL